MFDSLNKFFTVYIASVASKPFQYNNEEITPKLLYVSHNILRSFTCVSHCGGCCYPVSLVWINIENYESANDEAEILVNNKLFKIHIFSNVDHQIDKFNKHRCSFLNLDNGYCNIHKKHPFLCDLAPVAVTQYTDRNVLSNRPFGRAWNRVRITGEKSAACIFDNITEESRMESVRKLKRMKEWADYFEIETHLESIINWAINIPIDHKKPYIIPVKGQLNGL